MAVSLPQDGQDGGIRKVKFSTPYRRAGLVTRLWKASPCGYPRVFLFASISDTIQHPHHEIGYPFDRDMPMRATWPNGKSVDSSPPPEARPVVRATAVALQDQPL